MTHRAIAVLSFLALLPAPVVASGGMQPGLWEVTTRMEMTGMPVKMPPITIRHCYTRQDLDKGSNVPQSDDRNCKVKDYKLKGDTATWNIVCTGKNAMTGAGTMTVKSTSYTGKMQFTMKDGESANAVTHLSGKRVGDCKK